MIAAGAAYVAFIFVYDVPMYWSRWLADQAKGRTYLSIADGMVDVWKRWTVSYRWEERGPLDVALFYLRRVEQYLACVRITATNQMRTESPKIPAIQ